MAAPFLGTFLLLPFWEHAIYTHEDHRYTDITKFLGEPPGRGAAFKIMVQKS